MVGQEIVDRYRIENHHGTVLDEHTYLGESPRGVPIWIDRRYVEADLKITTGLIEPHLMAGFSGGRKLICPGIAALETVKVWHGPDFLEHPKADCGILEGNPVHEENTWIARHAGCDFIVNVVIDAERRPLKWVAGDMEAAFLEGVEFVRGVVVDTVARAGRCRRDQLRRLSARHDLLSGREGTDRRSADRQARGHDHHGRQPLRRDRQPEFQTLFRDNPNLEVFVERILGKDYFVMDQWQLEELAKVRRKARVKIVSDGLPAETIDSLFVESAEASSKPWPRAWPNTARKRRWR